VERDRSGWGGRGRVFEQNLGSDDLGGDADRGSLSGEQWRQSGAARHPGNTAQFGGVEPAAAELAIPVVQRRLFVRRAVALRKRGALWHHHRLRGAGAGGWLPRPAERRHLPDDFFIGAYTGDLASGFTPVSLSPPGSGSGLFVDATTSSPNSTPFYGIRGGSGSETFTRLFLGFSGSIASGAAPPFAISTLEVLGPAGGGGAGTPSAVPVPPTAFALAIGLAGISRLRRRPREA